MMMTPYVIERVAPLTGPPNVFWTTPSPLSTGSASTSLPCSALIFEKEGDAGTIVRDAVRQATVSLIAPKEHAGLQLMLHPWASGSFRVKINGSVTYEAGPIPLVDGDTVQLCLPGEFEDACVFSVHRKGAALDSSAGVGPRLLSRTAPPRILPLLSASEPGSPLADTAKPLQLLGDGLKEQGSLINDQEHFYELECAKWNNFYSYQYSTTNTYSAPCESGGGEEMAPGWHRFVAFGGHSELAMDWKASTSSLPHTQGPKTIVVTHIHKGDEWQNSNRQREGSRVLDASLPSLLASPHSSELARRCGHCSGNYTASPSRDFWCYRVIDRTIRETAVENSKDTLKLLRQDQLEGSALMSTQAHGKEVSDTTKGVRYTDCGNPWKAYTDDWYHRRGTTIAGVPLQCTTKAVPSKMAGLLQRMDQAETRLMGAMSN